MTPNEIAQRQTEELFRHIEREGRHALVKSKIIEILERVLLVSQSKPTYSMMRNEVSDDELRLFVRTMCGND